MFPGIKLAVQERIPFYQNHAPTGKACCKTGAIAG
jgi:hypothetical protein